MADEAVEHNKQDAGDQRDVELLRPGRHQLVEVTDSNGVVADSEGLEGGIDEAARPFMSGSEIAVYRAERNHGMADGGFS